MERQITGRSAWFHRGQGITGVLSIINRFLVVDASHVANEPCAEGTREILHATIRMFQRDAEAIHLLSKRTFRRAVWLKDATEFLDLLDTWHLLVYFKGFCDTISSDSIFIFNDVLRVSLGSCCISFGYRRAK